MIDKIVAVLLVFFRNRSRMCRANPLSKRRWQFVAFRKCIHPEIVLIGADLSKCVFVTQRGFGQVLKIDRHGRHLLGKLKATRLQQRISLFTNFPKQTTPLGNSSEQSGAIPSLNTPTLF